jgi:hypothetical protein
VQQVKDQYYTRPSEIILSPIVGSDMSVIAGIILDYYFAGCIDLCAVILFQIGDTPDLDYLSRTNYLST